MSKVKSIAMEKMNDLRDLLRHEIADLISAEEQIIKAMPGMIEKAVNPDLKSRLNEHLVLTHKHLQRLQTIQQGWADPNGEAQHEKKGLLSRLFTRNQVCKGMKGLIEEGEKIMSEEMSPEVLDAAIIAAAQKIEHYEICGYGTARAYALELNLEQIAETLYQTLKEEYFADDVLTKLAVQRLNKQAEGGEASTPQTQAPHRSLKIATPASKQRITSPEKQGGKNEVKTARDGSAKTKDTPAKKLKPGKAATDKKHTALKAANKKQSLKGKRPGKSKAGKKH